LPRELEPEPTHTAGSDLLRPPYCRYCTAARAALAPRDSLMQQERREKDVESKLSEEKPLEEVLGRVLKASPTLSTLFLKGQRRSKPFAGAGSQSGKGGGAEKKGEAAFNGRRHPTNHTDFVVAPLDQMFMLWSAVPFYLSNRRMQADKSQLISCRIQSAL